MYIVDREEKPNKEDWLKRVDEKAEKNYWVLISVKSFHIPFATFPEMLTLRAVERKENQILDFSDAKSWRRKRNDDGMKCQHDLGKRGELQEAKFVELHEIM